MPKSISGTQDNPKELVIGDDDDGLVCGACLLDLFSDDSEYIGAPGGCPHLFHWDCLEHWAEMQNTCTQCKHRFRIAGKYRSSNRELVECVKFKKRNRVGSDLSTEDSPDLMIDICEKCKEPGKDEDFILCDGMDFTCNALFHYRCVGFDSVPPGLWFCGNCIEKGFVPPEVRRVQKHAEGKPKKVAKRPRAASPRPKSRSRSPTRSRSPHAPEPVIRASFPARLFVQAGANRRSGSTTVPRNLTLDRSTVVPTMPPPSTGTVVSVFERFRQRRLEKKAARGNSTSSNS